jgi:hypothetical protein
MKPAKEILERSGGSLGGGVEAGGLASHGRDPLLVFREISVKREDDGR